MIYLFAIAVVAFVVYAWQLEQRSVFIPFRAIEQSPEAVGLPYEDVTLSAADGTRLHGWYVPRVSPRATLLFFHGNGGNVSHRVRKIHAFHEMGLAVFIVDYRGYGRSAGRPSEKGLYQDADAAYRYLVKERGVTPSSKLILYGESLGSAVAVDLAARQPAAGVILEGAFTRVAEMARQVFPFVPTAFLRYRFDSLAKVERVTAPLLVIHSHNDEVVPFGMGRRIFDAAASDAKDIITVYGGHNESFYEYRREIRQKIDEFLDQAVGV
ncbi:MAG: alpha/beta hydrolase [Deltaproteobacteria bacterium]